MSSPSILIHSEPSSATFHSVLTPIVSEAGRQPASPCTSSSSLSAVCTSAQRVRSSLSSARTVVSHSRSCR